MFELFDPEDSCWQEGCRLVDVRMRTKTAVVEWPSVSVKDWQSGVGCWRGLVVWWVVWQAGVSSRGLVVAAKAKMVLAQDDVPPCVGSLPRACGVACVVGSSAAR